MDNYTTNSNTATAPTPGPTEIPTLAIGSMTSNTVTASTNLPMEPGTKANLKTASLMDKASSKINPNNKTIFLSTTGSGQDPFPMEKEEQPTKMEIGMMENSKEGRDVVGEVMSSTDISGMKVTGVTMPSMDLENYSGTMNFFSRVNSKTD